MRTISYAAATAEPGPPINPRSDASCPFWQPAADALAFLESHSRRLESASAEEILAWASNPIFRGLPWLPASGRRVA